MNDGTILLHRREQWCGPQTPPLFRTEVQTQTVVIRFHSDERVVRRGFLFSYELEGNCPEKILYLLTLTVGILFCIFNTVIANCLID